MNKLIFSLLAVFLFTTSPSAKAAENTSHVWTTPEMTELGKTIEGWTEPNQSENALDYGYLYYCQSASYVTGLWYYWYSYNLAVARYNALALCVNHNGYTCTVACR